MSIVYYRNGYAPDQYGENAWAVREMIEKSKAIKCPNIAYHLAGSKKIQQELARPGLVIFLFEIN